MEHRDWAGWGMNAKVGDEKVKIGPEGLNSEVQGSGNTDRSGGVEMWTREDVGEKFEGVLVAGGHGPGPFHPPHREGIAESLVGQVVAAGQLGVHLVALQHLVEEVDVARGQLQDLDLAQLVGG